MPTITVSTGYNNTSFSLNGKVNAGLTLKYASDDTSIATVSSAGVVTVKGAGMVKITVSTDGNDYYNEAKKTLVYHFIPQKGRTYTVGSLKYKVTNASTSGSGTVTLTGAAKKTLTSVTVPAKAKIGGYSYKVTAVGAKALKGQKKMTKLVIGANITSIGKQACYGDKKLKKVTVKTKKLKSVGAKAFDGIHKKAVFKVPAAKKAAYKKLFKGKTVK